MAQDWYDNKELYEMMVELSKGLEHTTAESEKTQVLIRDYNGLRSRLLSCEKQLTEFTGKETGGKNVWGYVVGAFGIASFLFSIVFHVLK